MHFAPSTTVATIFKTKSNFKFSTAFIISESFPTPDGSIIILLGLNLLITSSIDFEKSPTSEQQIQPELISLISIPTSFKKLPSIPISPNSFSINTTFSPLNPVLKSFLIKVVFPAPKNPEIISTFILIIFVLLIFILIISFFIIISQNQT